MFDSANPFPYGAAEAIEAVLALVTADGDDVMFVCASIHAGHDWRGKGGLLYVAVHRGHGVWTHVYRVVRDPRSQRLAVFVERVMAGDQSKAACAWALAGFTIPPHSSTA